MREQQGRDRARAGPVRQDFEPRVGDRGRQALGLVGVVGADDDKHRGGDVGQVDAVRRQGRADEGHPPGAPGLVGRKRQRRRRPLAAPGEVHPLPYCRCHETEGRGAVLLGP